ncbi:hypothetical protein OKJ48_00030 [Streptomyces kunmingensis]|uniref:8-amino-7-oxononanoate synthase n=1 Tax=Streptomyces kunmingensis TaxID=68225 RepID=A0ABU6C1R1_9ACTN|nr:hypothetical protein [Streptomyces kunmingensis]MEB3958657.1 hypothetical protein [Streptomyces kunmingensis]
MRVRTALAVAALTGAALTGGPERATMRLRDALEEGGVFGSVFCSPATPRKRSLVRLSLHAGLTDGQVEQLVTVCHQVTAHASAASISQTRS